MFHRRHQPELGGYGTGDIIALDVSAATAYRNSQRRIESIEKHREQVEEERVNGRCALTF